MQSLQAGRKIMNGTNWKRLAYVVAPLFLVAQFFGWIRGNMLADAMSEYQRVSVSAEKAEDDLKSAEQALLSARARHNPIYLEKLSLVEAQAASWNVKKELLLAKNGGHPDKVRQHTKAVYNLLPTVRKVAGSVTGYIQFLDTAWDRYRTEPDRLVTQASLARTRIAELEAEGYFPRHFESAVVTLKDAEERNSFALKLRGERFWRDLPDYKQIYEICLVVGNKIDGAKASAQTIVILRQSNNERVDELTRRLATTQQHFAQARNAAMNLEAYPRYRVLNAVVNDNLRLRPLTESLGSAQSLNSMATQQFVAAAASLDSTSSVVAGVKKRFDQAIGTWSRLASAINQIPKAERDAASEINSAQSHISSYSHNSQGTANSYLAQARSELSEARSLRSIDPIEALRSFQEAESQASSAYSSVDTSSRDDDNDSHTSGWGFDSGDSSSSSSSGGYGGGGLGGGGYGGGGDSGSSSSGPSGSMSSGPSGSSSSGPSGGGVGSGGF